MPKLPGIAVALLAAVLATPIPAQVFPTAGDTAVTDEAQLIDAATEARIAARLALLKTETGSDFRVVTLPATLPYTLGEEVPAYAAMLARSLGLTEAAEGRWTLMLVLAEDRTVRIDTGPAFGDRAAAAQAVIQSAITPAFADGDYARGIDSGVNGVITTVLAAAPVAADPANAPTPEHHIPQGQGLRGLFLIAAFAIAVIAAIVALVRGPSAPLAAGPCPACGNPGLTRERAGSFRRNGEPRLTCPSCGYDSQATFPIAKTPPQGNS